MVWRNLERKPRERLLVLELKVDVKLQSYLLRDLVLLVGVSTLEDGVCNGWSGEIGLWSFSR